MAITPLRILIVEDESALREVLRVRLRGWGMEVALARTGAEADELITTFVPHVVLSDVLLPDRSGLQALADWLSAPGEPCVVLMTAYGSIDDAVEAMKSGATDFLTKPLDYHELRATLESVAGELELRRSAVSLESHLGSDAALGPLIGRTPVMRELYDLVRTVAASDASAILTGESGTGKELVSRTIHDLSQRRDGPFVAVNAAAIPEGLTEAELFGYEKGAFTGAVQGRAGMFELAHGGTLFLDEITEMPVSLQPKFLRVLESARVRRLGAREETPFDVRVIAATNRDVQGAVDERLLRADLFYRLNVFTITTPPLRERYDDVPLLVQHLIGRYNEKHGMRVRGVRREVEDRLKAYAWPGNVRELGNVVERAVILARDRWIEMVHLPAFLKTTKDPEPEALVLPLDVTAAQAEELLIKEVLRRVGNNKAEAARRLDLDVKTIRNKLKSFGDPASSP